MNFLDAGILITASLKLKVSLFLVFSSLFTLRQVIYQFQEFNTFLRNC